MSIRKATIRGLKWSTIGVIGASLFQLLQVAVLTRYLPKEAFGIVAMALFVVQFTNVFVEMGLSSAILHRQQSNLKEYSSIYWLSIGFSFFLYFGLVLSAEAIGAFYNEPELERIIILLGLNILFVSAGRQHRTIMQKQFRFKAIAVIELASYAIGLISAVLFALFDFGVYSLVFSTIIASVVANSLFLFQNLKKNPIIFYFRLRDVKPFLKVGGFSLGSTLLDFFSREIDILIIGKILGADVLGVYSLSKQIVLKLYRIVNPVVVNVLSPLLSSIQTDKMRVKFYYLQIVNVLSMINFPLYFLLAVVSKELLYILYGADFVEGYLILTLLSIAYSINSVGNPVGSLQVATGRTDLGFIWTIFRVVFLSSFIFVASYHGLNEVGATIALAGILFIYPSWKIMLEKMAGISFVEYLQQFWKPLLLMFSLLWLFFSGSRFITFELSIVYSLVVKSILAAIFWGAGVYLFCKPEVVLFKNVLKARSLK